MKWIADLDSFVIGHTVNSVLCAAIGALLGGVRGGLIGVAAGMVLTVLPPASRFASHWLGVIARGFIVVTGLPIALAMLAIARGANRLAARLEPACDALAPVAAGVGRSARAMRATAARIVSGGIGLLVTPLGLANLAAAVVLVLDVAGVGFATIASVAGFVILVLMLLVDDDERRHAAADERDATGA
ncbi:MAG: hypothetical protein AB7O88_20195 [Reyranellaceae bacterium]